MNKSLLSHDYQRMETGIDISFIVNYLIHFKARDFPYSSRMASNFQEVFNFTTRKRGQNAMLFAFGKMCCVFVDLQQQKKQEKRRFPNNQLPLLRICYMLFCFLSVNLALFG